MAKKKDWIWNRLKPIEVLHYKVFGVQWIGTDAKILSLWLPLYLCLRKTFFNIEVDGFTLPLNKIKIQYKSLKLKN